MSKPDEVVYRDRGYSWTETKGYNATMKKGARNHPIDIRDKMRNKRISRKRAPDERPYAVIKNVFKSGHVRVTTVGRVYVKMMFASFGFNLYQLRTPRNTGGIAIAI